MICQPYATVCHVFYWLELMVQVIGGGDCHHQLLPHQSLPVRTLCVVGWLSFSLHFSLVLYCLCWSAPPLRGGQMQYCRDCVLGCHLRTPLPTLPSFLCHTGGFFCWLPHCLLIRLNVGSNLSYLFSLSLQNQSIDLDCALAGNNLPQTASHYITFFLFTYHSFIVEFYSFSSRLCVLTPCLFQDGG